MSDELKYITHLLTLINQILGKPGRTYFLNAGIINHYTAENVEDKIDNDIIVIGRNEKPITLLDIAKAFKEASKLPCQEGRSYFWEGARINKYNDLQMLWGS